MTNEEALTQLNELKDYCEVMVEADLPNCEATWKKDVEALDIAIKALEQTDVLDKLLAIIAQKREFINNIKEPSYVCDGYSLCLQMIEGQIIKLKEEPILANNHYMQRFMRVE